MNSKRYGTAAVAFVLLAGGCADAAGGTGTPVDGVLISVTPRPYAYACDPAYDPPRCEHQPAEPFRYPARAFVDGWSVQLVNAGELPLEYTVDTPVLLEPSHLEANVQSRLPANSVFATHPACGTRPSRLEVTSARTGVLAPLEETRVTVACLGTNCEHVVRRSWRLDIHTNEDHRTEPLSVTLSPGCPLLRTCGDICDSPDDDFLMLAMLDGDRRAIPLGSLRKITTYHWRGSNWQEAEPGAWLVQPPGILAEEPDAGPGWFRATATGSATVTGFLGAFTRGSLDVQVTGGP